MVEKGFMKDITLEELLEAGCHFGHQVTRHNPKSRDFVFEARDNIHIIDLAKTKEGLDEATSFIRNLAKKDGSTIIVVGTKRQAQPIVIEQVEKLKKEGIPGIYYVTNRWIGGILTNFPEVLKNFKKLKELGYRLQSDDEKAKYTKKEVGMWEKSRQKLESFYGGICDMERTPDALFIVDTHMEDLAVRESMRTNTTTVGIVDTNADPAVINYPIPANDDAAASLQLIISRIADAWAEGKQECMDQAEKIKKQEDKLIAENAKKTESNIKVTSNFSIDNKTKEVKLKTIEKESIVEVKPKSPEKKSVVKEKKPKKEKTEKTDLTN
ncbi:30S ribosomal protein S2 [Candidatus Levyibacteriota bacterium]|nr:30S ribosomal protein S2 [Candidatus Levybacteria bacterium]